MKYNLRVNYTDAQGVQRSATYVNQTSASVLAILPTYVNDASLSKISFQAQELTAQQSAAIEAQAPAK